MSQSNIDKQVRKVIDTIGRNKSSLGNPKAVAFLSDLNDILLFVEQNPKAIKSYYMASMRLQKVKESLGM